MFTVTRLFDTNLHRVIYSGHALTDAHIQYILWQIFRALRYLHAAGVMHRDMKPTNLLLNRDCELALADFGLARYIPNGGSGCAGAAGASSMPRHLASSCAAVDVSDAALPDGDASAAASSAASAAAHAPVSRRGQLTKYVVTRWYRAPELLVQNRQYDCKVDLWSTGCLIAELLGCRAIFPGKDSLHQLRLIVELLGVPTESELDFIQNPQALSYIRGPKGEAGGRLARRASATFASRSRTRAAIAHTRGRLTSSLRSSTQRQIPCCST